MSFNKPAPLIIVMLLTGLILTMTGCAFNKVEIQNPQLLEGKKTVYIYADDDRMGFKENVEKGLSKLGFRTTEIKGEADLTVDYHGNCYWDVFHYTCSKLNFFITERKSRQVLINARFFGSVPYSVETIILNLFKEIQEEIILKTKRACKTGGGQAATLSFPPSTRKPGCPF